MDLKSNHTARVLTDPIPVKSRLGIHSNLLPYSSASTNTYPSVPSLTIPRKKPGKLDDIRASWFDAMQSSSPPRKKLNKDFVADDTTTDSDSYSYWLLKYPSALKSFEDITFRAKGKQIALFLDYDGTLSPIVDDPDCAIMSDSMRDVVRNVAKHFPTAIISGRSSDKVFAFIGLTELYYAGSHGMDIIGPATHSVSVNGHLDCIRTTDEQGKEINLLQPASEFLPMIDEVLRSLIESTKEIEGSKVENNKFCVSVHYRNVEEKYWIPIAQIVNDIMKQYPRLRLTHGRKVLEVRPVIDWNKGKAVEFLLESLGFGDSSDVFPIYVGDDRTDEDAFKVLRNGSRGCGILVSDVPKETNAIYSVRDPSEVMEFLNSLVRWKRAGEGA